MQGSYTRGRLLRVARVDIVKGYLAALSSVQRVVEAITACLYNLGG